MIFLDSNVFLRFLTPPATAGDASRRAVAELLFELVENGDLEVTTSEVVLHEVSFVLCSPKQYRRKAAEVAPVLREMIQWPGFSIQAADLRVYLRALDLWEQHPVLEFADAVIAARCERGGYELATFDGHFDRVTTVRKWSPEVDPEPAGPT